MITVTLHSLGNATQDERAIANDAAALLQTVVNDARFFPQVESRTYSTTWWESDQNEGEQLEPKDVTSVIANGRESRSSVDQKIDLNVSLMRLGGNVDGAVIPPSPEILIDASFYRSCVANQDLPSIAGLFMHEWMHTAGFRHDLNFPQDPDDVCYQVGDMATKLGRAIVTPAAGFQPFDAALRSARASRVWKCPATIDPRTTAAWEAARRRLPRDPIPASFASSETSPATDAFRSWIPSFLADLLLDPHKAVTRAELDAVERALVASMKRQRDGGIDSGPKASQVLGRLDALFGDPRRS